MNSSFLYQKSPWMNPRFDLKTMPEYEYQKRFAFQTLQAYLHDTKLMIHIRGLRRLGKSTLMKQVIINLIEREKIEPEKIVLVEFSPTETDLDFVLQNAPAGGYLFLDEIQHCPNWRDSLKNYYDSNQATNARLIFTGSATLSYTQSQESLLGRFLPIDLQPLRFSEYVYLKYGTQQNQYYNTNELLTYMEYGEFPELLSMENESTKRQYLVNSILDPLFTTDVSLYSVEKKDAFSTIFKLVSANIGQVISKQNIAIEAGISRPLLDKYILIMEDMGLIRVVSNYYKSIGKTESSSKKIYTASLNLSLGHLGFFNLEQIPLPGFKGTVFENFVYNELIKQFDQVFYWKRQTKELDFVCRNGQLAQKMKAYEVKSKTSMGSHERSRYARYAQEVGTGEVTGVEIEFAPIVWSFDSQQSALRDILMTTPG